MTTFTDAPYQTAKQKQKVDSQWRKLLEANLSVEMWARSKPLYEFLTLRCGFIAHYNQGGFYDAQMSTPSRALAFLVSVEKDLEKLAEGYYPADAEYQDIGASMLATLKAESPRLAALLHDRYLAGLVEQRDALDAEIKRLTGEICSESLTGAHTPAMLTHMTTETPINEKPYPEGHRYVSKSPEGVRVLDDDGYGGDVWYLHTDRPVVLGASNCVVPLICDGQTGATIVSPREALWVARTFDMKLVPRA